MLVTSLVNLIYFSPKNTSIKREKKQQETRDGKKSYDIGPQSEIMQALNKMFGVWHGVSSLVNMIGIPAIERYLTFYRTGILMV